jgi:predicted DNA-binding ribbon-helix-helix protein
MGRKAKSITQRQLEVLSARVNYELYQQIELIAKRRDLTMAQILRIAAREYVLRNREQVA